ncbi:MAG: hypothetical protein MZV65_16140 [Chromatiales bacterium]|nr:hypothetical protein [Chromatiales bacterium]
MTMRVLGVLFFVLVGIGAQWMARPPEGRYKLRGLGADGEAEGPFVHFSQKEMISTASFYKMWIAFMAGTASGLMMIGIASPVGQSSRPDWKAPPRRRP